MPTHVIGEGDTDRVVLERLGITAPAGATLKVFPQRAIPGSPPLTPSGREGAMRSAIRECRMGDTPMRTIVLALDLNGRQPAELRTELRALRSAWDSDVDPYLGLNGHRIRVVPCGLPTHAAIRRLAFAEFSMDDYVVALLDDVASYDAFMKSETKLPTRLSHADVRVALDDVIDVLKKRGVKINASKRYLDLFRAVIGFTGQRASFFASVIEHADRAAREAVFKDLKAAIEAD